MYETFKNTDGIRLTISLHSHLRVVYQSDIAAAEAWINVHPEHKKFGPWIHLNSSSL